MDKKTYQKKFTLAREIAGWKKGKFIIVIWTSYDGSEVEVEERIS